jgi:hypothetical protein
MKPAVLTRCIIGVILASGLALGLAALGCDDTSSKPIGGPFPAADGGNGGVGGGNPNGDGGIGQDGGAFQDAPSSPTFDGGVGPPADAFSF